MPRARTAVTADEPDLAAARTLGIETCARIATFWGFTRTMGRTFGLLYLSADPLPQSEVQKQLGISAGNASMTLAALVRWGVVHREEIPGDRREHYRGETDFWKMISGVLNDRERREIRAAIEAVTKAEGHAQAAQRSTRGKKRAEAEFTAQRLQKLRGICELGETMLDMLLGDLLLDLGRFRDVFKGG